MTTGRAEVIMIIGTGGEEEHDVVERNGTDEIEQEPSLEVVLGDLTRVEDDFVGEIVGDDTCRNTCVIDHITHDRASRARSY